MITGASRGIGRAIAERLSREGVAVALNYAICEEFEKHVAGCNPCQVVVDNIRKTITLYKAGRPYDLPVKFRERLHSTLRDRWEERHGAK